MDECCRLQRFSPEGQGAAGGGSADDRAALQAAIDAAERAGGGSVRLGNGKTYRCVITTSVPDRGLIIKDNVIVEGNGATINLECTGDVYGVRLKNRSQIRNCTVAVTSSTSPGSQSIWHSCISAGDAYSYGGTTDSVSSFHTVFGWQVNNVILSSARSEGVTLIALYGGVNNGIIDSVKVGNASNIYGVVQLDWGFVGPIYSSGTQRTELQGNDPDTGAPYTNLKNMGPIYLTSQKTVDGVSVRG